ncbi:MAG TPA: hypothetical protein VHY18_07610 [Solirubrobacteraceae bacterium]|jgi:hypothetical protein|nr:hypothetical protein [Solirubrobacteraceae bacterium]
MLDFAEERGDLLGFMFSQSIEGGGVMLMNNADLFLFFTQLCSLHCAGRDDSPGHRFPRSQLKVRDNQHGRVWRLCEQNEHFQSGVVRIVFFELEVEVAARGLRGTRRLRGTAKERQANYSKRDDERCYD